MNARILYLVFSLFLVCHPNATLSQDKAAEDGKTQEDKVQEDKAPEDNGDQEVSDDVEPQQPQRLNGSLPRNRVPAGEVDAMEKLASYLDENAQLWLESEHGRFLSFWQQHRAAESKGALLIIHAEGEHPAWPKIHKPLHDSLPNYGWSTLAISVPKHAQQPIPQRSFPPKVKVSAISVDQEAEENKDQPQEGDKEAEKNDNNMPTAAAPTTNKPVNTTPNPITGQNQISTEIIIEKRLETALAFLHDEGQYNIIVLGSGSGAIHATEFIRKTTPKIDNPALKAKLKKPFYALILINADNQLPGQASYSNWFHDPALPILDIYLADGYGKQNDAKARKILAKQYKAAHYKQVALTSIHSEKNWEENKISRRVRGFLEKYVAGIEVDRATYKRVR